MSVSPACFCIKCVHGAYGSQNRASEFWDLEIGMIYVGAGSQIWVLSL